MDIPAQWHLSEDGKALTRSFKFKDFAEAFGRIFEVLAGGN